MVLGLGAAKFYQAPSDDITIPGEPSIETLDRYNELFPSAGRSTGRVVLEAREGQIAEHAEVITTLASDLVDVPGVSGAISPLENPLAVSEDGTVAYITLDLEEEMDSIDVATTDGVTELVEDARTSSLAVEMGGDIVDRIPDEIIGAGEMVGVVLSLVILLIALGSIVAAGLPIIVSLLTVAAGAAGLFALSEVIDINATTPALAIMLGLAVGIDYSLFVINKYRFYLLQGKKHREAAGATISTAGYAVAFAAVTVVIALAALGVMNIPFITTMGLAAAATVVLAALAAVTLLPAMFGVVGMRIFYGKTRKAIAEAQKTGKEQKLHKGEKSKLYRWAEFITRRPIIFTVLALALIATIALPARDMQLALPTDEFAPSESTERKAFDMLTRGFGPGVNAPLLVLAEDIDNPLHAQEIAENISDLDSVDMAILADMTDDQTAAVVQVIPEYGPTDERTMDIISDIRDADTAQDLAGDASLGVTGSTAIQMDVDRRLAEALLPYIAIVVGLTFLLLIAVFRSILVPIKATLSLMLSVAVMFGAMVAVFQWGWFGVVEDTAPLVSFIPILAIGILFGLAIDYEFFLATNMHEEYERTGKVRQSIVRGFSTGAPVVIAASVIMTAVFAGFTTNADETIRTMGLGLAIGIFMDAFVVRMVLIPAVMQLMGRAAWWLPKWLQKILPKVPIE